MHKVNFLKTSQRNFHTRVIGLRFPTSAPHAIMPKLHYAGNNWSLPTSSMAQFIHDIIRVHKWSPLFSNRLNKLCLILMSIPDALPTWHLNPRTFLSLSQSITCTVPSQEEVRAELPPDALTTTLWVVLRMRLILSTFHLSYRYRPWLLLPPLTIIKIC